MPLEHVDTLIIGGGVAGLSTACHLARAGLTDTLLVEREDLPGFYASGHNAGIARQLTGRAEHTALTIQGRQRLAQAGLLTPTGGWLLGAEPDGCAAAAEEADHFDLPTQRQDHAPYPGLRAADALHIPSDGQIDTGAMLNHLAEAARTAGARLSFGCQVQAIRPEAGGFRVSTDQGEVQARRLVNAAGGWAGAIGRMAGGLDLAFAPLRRHLVWSTAPYPAERAYTWWLDRPLYVRPESGGLLLCACEEQTLQLPPRGLQPGVDDSILEGLAGSLKALAPALTEAPLARVWSGVRTFAPDRRFVLGPDPVNPALFWVAGLGGHGMTSGLAVGALAARSFLDGESTGPLDPARFLQH